MKFSASKWKKVLKMPKDEKGTFEENFKLHHQ